MSNSRKFTVLLERVVSISEDCSDTRSEEHESMKVKVKIFQNHRVVVMKKIWKMYVVGEVWILCQIQRRSILAHYKM